ncbi:hypothetical protein S245_058657 [Arachis hypogaea]|uniref:RING-type domain-containing protein n=1 Tax=Arachis hypogaea TaxID=3818 RepID=A0A444YDF7_ARAHY|nr:putative E3 ubiquitin-protein ligase RHA2B [Arachis hypogaea]RYQ99950.1 hypothetical protein Ahy_B07g087979 [Arachis hypogaea]
MEFTVSKWQIAPIEDPAIPQEFYFGDCVSIVMNCTEELIQITPQSNPNFSSTTTTANKTILVSSNILCSCTPLTVTDLNRKDTILLHKIFSSAPVSSELLDQILPDIGRIARRILRRRHQGCDSYTPEIVVNLHVTTHIIVQDSDIYDDDAECAICLEKFGDGNEDSSVGVVRTNCLHVFHDRCMLCWLQCCDNCQWPYSCPLCRCIIFPTSHSHDE